MQSAERRLDAIAHNLANASTSGFKRRSVATTNFADVLGARSPAGLKTEVHVDHTQGVFRETGNTYDLALGGDGFFVVESGRGQVYTRNGRFQIDDKGNLITLDGKPVVWEGSRGTIDTGGEVVTIDPVGSVWQGGSQLGSLKIVSFDNVGALVPTRDGRYAAPAGILERPSEATVYQGRVEMSNVSPVEELVAMIAVQRRFESAARLLGVINQSYRQLNRPR